MTNIKAFAFDLDGTIYNGDRPVEGAREMISGLRERNYGIFYFTNNSAKSRGEIVDKLNRMGFRASLKDTYCTSWAVSNYLAEKKIRDVYLIGSKSLKNELLSRRIKIKSRLPVSAVVVGLDHSFNYGKIATALEAIRRGARFIAANVDPSYPSGNNVRLPGCGAMVGAIAGATGHWPDFNAGKPNSYMLKLLCREHNFSPKKICIVGDSPESDIAMAESLNCPSLLFDPKNDFPGFSGRKVKKHREISVLFAKKRGSC
jgi:4-nitrophenyl phosphatase